MNTSPQKPLCKILSLDGGGSKGMYTLGVLSELEAALGDKPLGLHFDLIYGTSTGAIIATMLGLGKSVSEIVDQYRRLIPEIMSQKTSNGRTQKLELYANELFGHYTVSDLKVKLGIVASKWLEEKPMIFKSNLEQAHGMTASFKPGFGCSLADAVVSSCSAYPLFERKVVQADDGLTWELIDGGYIANNPTLFSISDAVGPLNYSEFDLRVVSVGVGDYIEPIKPWYQRMIFIWTLERLLKKTLNMNTRSMEQLTNLIFKNVPIVRINESSTKGALAVDLLESDIKKLNLLFQFGRDSFRKYEVALRALNL
ncbi:patatin-like phospholipase family protein [Polynucleobacter sp. MWH-UH19D]|uniref:patatin-like phospholipase family protein n=1 Tax=Polynucleobacter sp. MWH-UH19D TaxID=1855610 RepID=UPI003364F408